MQISADLVPSIFLYACESWTLTEELQRIQAMEIGARYYASHTKTMLPMKKSMPRSCRQLDHIKRRKLQWHGHVSRSSGLAKTVLQGTVKGGRRQGGQKKRWEDNISEWTGLEFGKSQRAVENRGKWRKLVAKLSVVPQRPSRLRD